MHRKAPVGYKQKKTETWQECQELCAQLEPCKGFSWHKKNNYWAKACSLFSAHSGKIKFSSVVSGPKECPKKREYDCEEDGVVYTAYYFPDAPEGYKEKKTETWQECQELCAELEPCKGFTWHKKDSHYAKGCSVFSAYKEKINGSAVSGLKECPKDAAGKVI